MALERGDNLDCASRDEIAGPELLVATASLSHPFSHNLMNVRIP
jgi:hypothetical protein